MSNFIKYTKDEFLNTNKKEFAKCLRAHIEDKGLEVGDSQILAWEDCYEFLNVQLRSIGSKLTMLFEYVLPQENNRRPDVILFAGQKIIVLEFKMKDIYKPKDIEQAIGYREDIKNFHEFTVKNNLHVNAFLVLTKSENKNVIRENGLEILSKENFRDKICPLINTSGGEIDVNEWGKSLYAPHPNIIEATQDLFLKGKLPYIKSIAKGDISKAVESVKKLILSNETDQKKRIIFLSGVPGAGKTLVGLKSVYDYNKYNYENKKEPIKSIYLSGNGPLVNVLQTQLSNDKVNTIEGKAYICGMINYKKEYLETDKVPNQTFLVFDEAQRAWDQEKMRKSYSEAQALLKIGDKIYNKFNHITILCLFGEGQAIHTGEEKGMKLWIDALSNNQDWEVYIPEKYNSLFEGICNTSIDKNLYLDTSIRTNFVDISKWIENVLMVDTDKSKKELEKLKEIGFKIRVTRDFDKLKRIMPSYKEKYNHKYGLIVSSKVEPQKLKSITNNICKTSFLDNNQAGKWFIEDCVKLKQAASEFLCQGLEIDMPIVVFGGDYLIENNKWTIAQNVYYKNKDKYNSFENIINSIYRVLLSRGKKGMILYIPNGKEFDETFSFFENIGVTRN